MGKRSRSTRWSVEFLTTAAAGLSLAATLFSALRGDPALAIIAVAVMIAAAISIGTRAVAQTIRAKEPPSLPRRIEMLVESLTETLEAVTEIERELTGRRELVQKLEADATRYEEAAKVNKEGFEAVQAMLKNEFQASERRSLRATALQGFVFFVLGVAASVAVALVAAG